ncbi:GntR family transcriptional regulator [Almyronema epifaneia]|uniref:GntR family transcriptional regulator n=1 Tax=Almyronema epifaneia S1 TaxID=2991925 RepID=A0ABW6IC66_9CYAN
MPSSPSPKATEDRVYTELYEAICERQLLPDTKLGEALLADHFGVSRTIIRQVLQRLAGDGLVRQEPHRGAFVARITLAEARQIYAAWRLVEATIIREVTPTMTSAQLQALRNLIAQERQACEQADYPLLTRLSSQFHMALAALSQNKYLGQFLRELIPLTALAYFYDVKNMPLCRKDEHSQILDCIEAGEAEQAVAIAEQHLDGIEAALDASASLDPQISLVDRLRLRQPSLSP